MKKHILITGGAGYIGSVLVGHLLSKGYQVTVLDMLYRPTSGPGLLAYCNNDDFFFWRANASEALSLHPVFDYDAVVHLASLLRPVRGAEFVFMHENLSATKAIFDASIKFGVVRLVFASTYFNYGRQNEIATEDSKLYPFCPYTKSKVECEKYVAKGPATILRFAQAYGLSPSMRFDLLVNRFVRDAITGNRIVVFERDIVRALVHVYDIARAIEYVLKAPLNKVQGEVFNVGSNDAHYTKDEIAQLIADTDINRVRIEYGDHKTTGTMPSTEVCFDKIRDTLGWAPVRGLAYGVMDMMRGLRELGLF